MNIYKTINNDGFVFSTKELNNPELIKISEFEYNNLKSLTNVTINENDKKKIEQLNRYQELLKEIAKTDYYALKYIDGELSFTEYEYYKNIRSELRKEIRILEKQLGVK